MIASWMLYALAISILISVAGVAAERALASRQRPTRFVWVATLLLSIAWPLVPAIARMLPAPPRPVQMLPFRIVVDITPAPAAIDWPRIVDRGLIALWIAASIVLAIRIVRGIALIERSRSAWKRGRVNGVRVKLSNNVGPAVVGLRSMDVVLPSWIMSLDESLREIVLRHEEEHRSARDPYLLFGAAVLVAALPWNLALWFQARRLRLAIEMDCDARVLRAHPSPERYGMLILTIAQRRSVAPAMFAPMLSEPATNLERRILAMRTKRAMARTTMYGGALVTIGVLVFASSLQSAGTSFPKPQVPHVSQAIARVAASMVPSMVPSVKPETIPVKPAKPKAERPAVVVAPIVPHDTQTVRRLNDVVTTAVSDGNPAPRYPAALKATGVEGMVVARFTSDANGAPIPSTIRIVTSTNYTLAKSVLDAIDRWRVEPNTTIQTPFVFVMADKSAKDLSKLPGGVPAGAVVITGAPLGEPVPVSDNQTYFEFQVERQASPMPGNPAPRYPDLLRKANIEGEVLAQFVLNTDGTPDMDTFKVLKSDHDLFTNAVYTSLPNMRFYPAQVGGKPVKQLVQMPFQFNLSK